MQRRELCAFAQPSSWVARRAREHTPALDRRQRTTLPSPQNRSAACVLFHRPRPPHAALRFFRRRRDRRRATTTESMTMAPARTTTSTRRTPLAASGRRPPRSRPPRPRATPQEAAASAAWTRRRRRRRSLRRGTTPRPPRTQCRGCAWIALSRTCLIQSSHLVVLKRGSVRVVRSDSVSRTMVRTDLRPLLLHSLCVKSAVIVRVADTDHTTPARPEFCDESHQTLRHRRQRRRVAPFHTRRVTFINALSR